MHHTNDICGKRLSLLMAIVAILLTFGPIAWAEPLTLNGGGASFPAPLYTKWFKDFQRSHPEIQINYKPFGSAAGISNFTSKRLDFAGSDVPMTDDQIAEVADGVVQVPMTAGAIVFIYNLEGIKDVQLSREAYTGIFLGTVKNWRDPLILETNKGLNLPDKEITVVVRVDGSGTTQVLTQHIGAVNPAFAKTVGSSKKPVWPDVLQREGRLEKVPGNGGVAQMIKVLPGSIGYTEYSYAYFTDISMATLQNKAGSYVYPTTHAFLEAVASTEVPSGVSSLRSIPIDPTRKGAYPILSLSWLLFNQTYKDPAIHNALKKVIDYCLNEGQKHSFKTGYIPIVEPLLSEARKNVKAIGLKK